MSPPVRQNMTPPKKRAHLPQLHRSDNSANDICLQLQKTCVGLLENIKGDPWNVCPALISRDPTLPYLAILWMDEIRSHHLRIPGMIRFRCTCQHMVSFRRAKECGISLPEWMGKEKTQTVLTTTKNGPIPKKHKVQELRK